MWTQHLCLVGRTQFHSFHLLATPTWKGASPGQHHTKDPVTEVSFSPTLEKGHQLKNWSYIQLQPSSFGVISCWNDSPTFNHSKVATSAQEHCLFPRHLWHFIAVPPLQTLVLYLFVMIQCLYPRPRPMLIFSDSLFQRIFTPKKSHSKLQCQTNQRWAAWLELSKGWGPTNLFKEPFPLRSYWGSWWRETRLILTVFRTW